MALIPDLQAPCLQVLHLDRCVDRSYLERRGLISVLETVCPGLIRVFEDQEDRSALRCGCGATSAAAGWWRTGRGLRQGWCWAQSSHEPPLSACLRGGRCKEWKWGGGTALAEGSVWVKFGRYVFDGFRGVVCLVDLRAGRGRRGTGRVPWARRGPGTSGLG